MNVFLSLWNERLSSLMRFVLSGRSSTIIEGLRRVAWLEELDSKEAVPKRARKSRGGDWIHSKFTVNSKAFDDPYKAFLKHLYVGQELSLKLLPKQKAASAISPATFVVADHLNRPKVEPP